nr:hypothetical protein [Actinomadura sp. HBU206391]
MHRSAARAGGDQADPERERAVHRCGGEQGHPGHREARAQHEPLTPAVRHDAPGDERGHQPGQGTCHEHARLAERQSVRTESRDEVRQAELEGGARGHRGESDREHHPSAPG